VDHSNQPIIPPAIKWGWLRAVLFMIAATMVSGITSLIGLVLIVIVFNFDLDLSLLFGELGEIMEIFGPFNMALISLFQLLGMILILWLFRKFIDKRSIMSLGLNFKPFRHDLLVGLLFGAAFILIGFSILQFCGYVNIIEIQFPAINLFNYLILFTIVSLNEEIMVRGYMLNNCMASMNKYTALIFTSLCFMIMHIVNANISILGMINLFLAGLVLGIYYIHKSNLWFSIGLHLTWNFFQGPVFGFEVSGFNTKSIITQEVQGSSIITGGQFGFEGSIIATILLLLMILLVHLRAKRI